MVVVAYYMRDVNIIYGGRSILYEGLNIIYGGRSILYEGRNIIYGGQAYYMRDVT